MKRFEDTTEDTKVEEPKAVNRGGSAAGVHYAQKYQACERKFHLEFNVGVKEKYLDKALIFGSSIHEAKAVWYLEQDEEKSIARGEKECSDRVTEFYTGEDYDFSISRVRPMMQEWFRTYGHSDLEKYKVIAIEQEVRLPVPFTPGFIHTQRHDAMLEDVTTQNIYTFDTKTASSSLDFTLNSTAMSDQVTSYFWGGTELFAKRYKGFVIDVQYWSTRSNNPFTIKCQRSEPLTRTTHELKVLQANLGAIFNELQAKQRALLLGTPSSFLYKKNTYYCMSFFRKCAYADVCPLADKMIRKRLPDHLTISEDVHRLDGLTYDNIFYGEGPYG